MADDETQEATGFEPGEFNEAVFLAAIDAVTTAAVEQVRSVINKAAGAVLVVQKKYTQEKALRLVLEQRLESLNAEARDIIQNADENAKNASVTTLPTARRSSAAKKAPAKKTVAKTKPRP